MWICTQVTEAARGSVLVGKNSSEPETSGLFIGDFGQALVSVLVVAGAGNDEEV